MKAIDLANFLSTDNLESLKQDNLLDVAMNDFFQTLLEQEDYCETVDPKMKDHQLISTFWGVNDINAYVEYHMRMGQTMYMRQQTDHISIEKQMHELATSLEMETNLARDYVSPSLNDIFQDDIANHYYDNDIDTCNDMLIE